MTTGRGPAKSRDALRALPNRESRAPEPAAHERAPRKLSPAECFDLLEPGGIGRVGTSSAEGIIMLPVNFAVKGKTIIFRTATDTLLALHANAHVSFEVDQFDEARHEGWTCLCKVTRTRSLMSAKSGTLRTQRASSRGQPVPATYSSSRADPDQRAARPAKPGHLPGARRGTLAPRPRVGCPLP